MNKSRIIVLFLALVFSLGAAMMVKSFMSAPPRPKVAKKAPVIQTEKLERVKILALAADVKMGERISATALQWMDWPKEMVMPKMITKFSKPDAMNTYAGARARTPMFTGEPFYADKVFTKKDGGFLSALLPKGMRAIAVRVSVETGAGGFIMPNDRVDVLLTRKSRGRTLSDTVLSNVRVMAIDQSYKIGDNGKKVADSSIKTATLELEPRQAEVLARAETMGQLSLALRSLADAGDSKLGDDGPRLSPKYASKNGGEVRILRYGIPRTQVRN